MTHFPASPPSEPSSNKGSAQKANVPASTESKVSAVSSTLFTGPQSDNKKSKNNNNNNKKEQKLKHSKNVSQALALLEDIREKNPIAPKDFALCVLRLPGKTKNGNPKLKFLTSFAAENYKKHNGLMAPSIDSPGLEFDWLSDAEYEIDYFAHMSEVMGLVPLTSYFWQHKNQTNPTSHTSHTNSKQPSAAEKSIEQLAQDFCDSLNQKNINAWPIKLQAQAATQYITDAYITAHMYVYENSNLFLSALSEISQGANFTEDEVSYVCQEARSRLHNEALKQILPLINWALQKHWITTDFLSDTFEILQEIEEDMILAELEDDIDEDSDNEVESEGLTTEQYTNLVLALQNKIQQGIADDEDYEDFVFSYNNETPEEDVALQATLLPWAQKVLKQDKVSELTLLQVLHTIVATEKIKDFVISGLVEPTTGTGDMLEPRTYQIELRALCDKPQELSDYAFSHSTLEGLLFVGLCAYAQMCEKAAGAIVIRGFSAEKKVSFTPVGKKKAIKIPEKYLYSFFIQNGALQGISAEDSPLLHETDSDTQEVMEREVGVVYQDAQELLASVETKKLMKSLMGNNTSKLIKDMTK